NADEEYIYIISNVVNLRNSMVVKDIQATNLNKSSPANDMLNPYHDILHSLFEKPLVARARRILHRRRQLASVGLQFLLLALKTLLPCCQVRQAALKSSLQLGRGLAKGGNLPLRRLSLFHQLQLLIFQPRDPLFANVNL